MGLKILTSKNALCREQSQKPSALMSKRALSETLAELGCNYSPDSGCRTGSVVT